MLIAARTVDGVALAIDRVAATAPARGAIVLLHAMMTDARYFGAHRPGAHLEDGFAHRLAALGLDVYVAEFRGHGRSVPPRAGDGDWTFDDLVELDLPAIVAAVPRDAILLGHSLGGLVALAALATGRIPPPRALVLATTNVWLGETWQRRAVMRIYDAATRAFGKAPIRALRIGSADEPPGYVAQLASWASHHRWTSRRGIDYQAALAAITTPTFAIAGTRDWMCRPGDADAMRARIPGARPHALALVDADHFSLFTDPEHAATWRAFTLPIVGESR